VVKGERLVHEGEAARVDAFKVEHVGHDVLHELGAGAERLKQWRHSRPAHGFFGVEAKEEARHVEHGEEGAAQVMHDHADHATARVLALVREVCLFGELLASTHLLEPYRARILKLPVHAPALALSNNHSAAKGPLAA